MSPESHVYDSLNRVVEETNELEGTASYVYNDVGLLVRTIDREGQVIVYGYDNLYRNTTEIWYNDTTDADLDQNRQNTISYTYDAVGNRLTAADDFASYVYEYDALNRVTEETQTIVGLTPVMVFNSQYSATGKRIELAATVGGTDDFVNAYSFNNLGRLTRLTQDDQGGYAVAEKRIDFAYDAAGRAGTITRYANLAGTQEVITGSYTFDTVGQLTNLVYTNSTPSTVRSFAWTYDAAGRIVAHDSDIAAEDVSDYSYDDTNQLTEADYTTGTDESYVYDDNGNRVTAGGSSYETGPNNQLVSDGYYRYEYDANGNLIYRYVDADASESLNAGDTDITEYEWDHRNRLTDVVHRDLFGGSTDWTAEYIYDCLDRRIGSLYDDDGNTSIDREERYVWEGRNAVLDFVDADGDGGAYSDELTTRYLWCTAVDKLLAQETVDNGGAEDVRWSVLDNLGSVRSLVNYTGAVTSTYSYDSFGNVTALVGSLSDSRYLYTGQEYDFRTGDYYYDARWYDPAVGTFISEDPIGILGNQIGPNVGNSSCCCCCAQGQSDADINLYRYCENNPVVHTDPTGLCKTPNYMSDDPSAEAAERGVDALIDQFLGVVKDLPGLGGVAGKTGAALKDLKGKIQGADAKGVMKACEGMKRSDKDFTDCIACAGAISKLMGDPLSPKIVEQICIRMFFPVK